MKLADILLMCIYAVVGAAIFLYTFQNGDVVKLVNIYSGNTIVRQVSVPVNEPITIELDEGDKHAVIQVEGSEAWFVESNCPDQICVDHGVTEHAYDIRVCLPNEFWIELEGGDDSIDAISK